MNQPLQRLYDNAFFLHPRFALPLNKPKSVERFDLFLVKT